MRTIPNEQVTRNFMLYEFIEAQLPYEAVALNWKYIARFDRLKWQELALELQKLRGLVNDNFKSDLGFDEIGLRITSGFRCIEWEILRNRSGRSQHTICAADFQPIQCSREQSYSINKWTHAKYDPFWKGGMAIKHASGDLIGFVHLDMRGEKARWTY